LDKVKEEVVTIDDINRFFMEFGVELTNDEFDYIILSMYRTSKDLNKLVLRNMIELFKEILNEYKKEGENPPVIRIDEVSESNEHDLQSKEFENNKCNIELNVTNEEQIGIEEVKEEPIKEESVKEESIREELTKEELMKKGLMKEELMKEELMRKELMKEELMKEEPMRKELKKEELMKKGLMRKELMKEELTKEELTKEEQVKEELIKEESLEGEQAKEKQNKTIEQANESIKQSEHSIQFNEELTEKEILETVQKIFSEIANKMHSLKLEPRKLFESNIQIKDNDELILSNDFFNTIQSLGLPPLSPKSHECVLTILSADEDENYVKLEDFVQVMNDYAQARKEPELSEVGVNDMIRELDNVTIIILFVLKEYLQEQNVSPNQFFEKHIQQINSSDIISFQNFITSINEIGIKVEGKNLKNLKGFLKLSEEQTDVLSLKKLTDAIEQFKTNKEIEEYGRQCFQELINKDCT